MHQPRYAPTRPQLLLPFSSSICSVNQTCCNCIVEPNGVTVFCFLSSIQNMRPNVDNIPRNLGSLITACWAENPADRPEFVQISETLENILGNITDDMLVPEANSLMNEDADSPGTSWLMDQAIINLNRKKLKKKNKKKKAALCCCFSSSSEDSL